MSCLVSVCYPSLGSLRQYSTSHQLPRLFVEEELAKRQVPAHQDYHGQACPALLIDGRFFVHMGESRQYMEQMNGEVRGRFT
jgi:N-acetylmuramoyl-L-alanine amidase CwlA